MKIYIYIYIIWCCLSVNMLLSLWSSSRKRQSRNNLIWNTLDISRISLHFTKWHFWHLLNHISYNCFPTASLCKFYRSQTHMILKCKILDVGPRFEKNLTTNRRRNSIHLTWFSVGQGKHFQCGLLVLIITSIIMALNFSQKKIALIVF